jgi:predicted nucleic acid-binding protein
LRAFVDTNVLIRHLTGEPEGQARKVRRLFESDIELVLTDLVTAELAYVLTSFYKRQHTEVATALRSLITFERILTEDASRLLRSVDLYEDLRLDFADAYLLACAESGDEHAVVSFDKDLGRLAGVTRIEP